MKFVGGDIVVSADFLPLRAELAAVVATWCVCVFVSVFLRRGGVENYQFFLSFSKSIFVGSDVAVTMG